MFTELVPVRMGEPDALIVGNHHEQHAGALLDLCGECLQLPVRQLVGERRTRCQRGNVVARDVGTDGGRKGDRTRHVQRPGFVLGGKALVTHEGKQPARDPQRERHDGDLQQQHLGSEPHVHVQPSHHEQSVRASLSIMSRTRNPDVAGLRTDHVGLISSRLFPFV